MGIPLLDFENENNIIEWEFIDSMPEASGLAIDLEGWQRFYLRMPLHSWKLMANSLIPLEVIKVGLSFSPFSVYYHSWRQ